MDASNPSTQAAGAGGSLWILGQLGLQSEFQDIQGCYKEKPYLKKPKTNKQKPQTNKQKAN